MEVITTIVLILAALLAGAIGPGPGFVLVARISMVYSRGDGIAAAIGMGIGGSMIMNRSESDPNSAFTDIKH